MNYIYFALFLLCVYDFANSQSIDIVTNIVRRLQKVEHELTFLKESNFKLQKYVNTLNEKCQIVGDSVCGPCMCRDDDRLVEGYYCDCQMLQPKRDCLDFYNYGLRISGVYKIHQNILKIIQVFCDQETDGGGWTVIQRRIDGSVNFFRDWNDYEKGFGQLQNEFWLGNKNLFTLTHQDLRVRGNELRVELTNAKKIKQHAKYGKFQVGSPNSRYRLLVGEFDGTATDELSYNNGMKFSTFDFDNDEFTGNCALSYNGGGWWYKKCFNANLNGVFYPGGKMLFGEGSGIHWGWNTPFSNHKDSPLIFSEMKVRRKL